MVYLLLGPNDFSKDEYVRSLAVERRVEAVFMVGEEGLALAETGGQDLFSRKKMFVLTQALAGLTEQILSNLITSKNDIYFLEQKIDKRSTISKKLLGDKSIIVKEFPLPHGKQLDAWIINRVRQLGGLITNQVANELAIAMGRDEAKELKFGGKIIEVTEIFTLWDVDNEIKKLIAYSAGAEISSAAVAVLVPKRHETDVLSIVNAIADNQRQHAYQLMEIFLNSESLADEKGKIIQLNALLSEQFRNVAMIQSFLQDKVPEQQILDKTKWKSGRLFVIKKIATKFTIKKVLDLLNKLSHLDEELKTSNTPPRVLLDLIFSQF